MSGNSETVSYELELLFITGGRKIFYRLEPSLGKAKSDLDLAGSHNLEALKLAGKT